ncbi:MAG: choline-binding protein A [Veillonella sp.]|uniref:choline-binding protein A n=1 Tax=Veillonella sp. TaxID=1926307 RepID=UPI0028FF2922|nr:choline-binding protein A [Veillonella sp.]MDU2711712.1 choline-binding protein A [Veillonella sp.]
MENQNILTIKFNTLDDLAVQVADWNERLNHQCCGNCSNVEAPTVTVGETIDIEVAASEVAGKVDTKQQPETVEVERAQKDVPVTDFEGKLVTDKKEEKVEQVEETVAEPAPVETPTDESTTTETPEQDAALDVTAEPIDKKAFFREMKVWMGEDKGRAGKIITVFNKYGVTERFSSDVLTNDIITDLKTVMAGEE